MLLPVLMENIVINLKKVHLKEKCPFAMESLAVFAIQGLKMKDCQIWVVRHPFTETHVSVKLMSHVSFLIHGLESG